MDSWWATLWEHTYWPVPWAVAILVTVIAATTDCKTRRIPNLLTFPAFFAGLIYATLTCGFVGLADAFAGALLAMGPFVLMFLFAGGGAGDAKLMGALGAWLGVLGGAITLIAVMIAGGLLSLVFIVFRHNGKHVWANLLWIFDSLRAVVMGNKQARSSTLLPRVESLHVMPYGLAIFLGTCIATGGAWLWHA